MPFWKDDVAALIGADMGVAVVFGQLSTYGHFDRASADIRDIETGQSVAVVPAVTVKFDAFPTMPVKGDALRVDGRAYTVRDVDPVDDGALTRLTLA